MQRVSRARVVVDGRVSGAIENGLLVFAGVGVGDRESDADWMADKIAGLRIFRDEHDLMNLSVEQAGGSVLLVSQFTLFGDARRGRRPSFAGAAAGERARELYERVGTRLQERGLSVAYGVFGADMDVEASNQGPVTILVDSERTF
ncbi:MAG TPA: D-aminoacyl-tRNA deacylase [Candidatus Tumulicola sp.]